MADFSIYAMCNDCLVIYGPFTDDEERDAFFAGPHPIACNKGIRITPVPKTTTRTYSRGDASRPFGSSYDGNCWHCGFGYLMGDFIRMVTVTDGEKGKACHEDCAEQVLAKIAKDDEPDQDDEPPF